MTGRFLRIRLKGGRSRLVEKPRGRTLSHVLYGSRNGLYKDTLTPSQTQEDHMANLYVNKETGAFVKLNEQDQGGDAHYEDADGKSYVVGASEFFAAHRELTEDERAGLEQETPPADPEPPVT